LTPRIGSPPDLPLRRLGDHLFCGWSAAPDYYNVIAGAIHWTHNNGPWCV
jgi:hypothetical protein